MLFCVLWNKEQKKLSLNECLLVIVCVCRWGKIPSVYCSILSRRTGYFVIRCVTNKMHSGISRLFTKELLLCCCGTKKIRVINWNSAFIIHQYATDIVIVWFGSHLDEELKSLVLLLKLFEVADRFCVMTAKLTIHLLHVLCILLRELWWTQTHTYDVSHDVLHV